MCTPSFLVCVLSVLVTVLVGLNVWAAVGVKSEIEKYKNLTDNKIQEFENKIEKQIKEKEDVFYKIAQIQKDRSETKRKELEKTFAISRGQIAGDFADICIRDNRNFDKVIKYLVHAVCFYAIAKEYDIANAYANLIIKTYSEPDKIPYSFKEKNKLYNDLQSIPKEDKVNIDNIEKISEVIQSLNNNYEQQTQQKEQKTSR